MTDPMEPSQYPAHVQKLEGTEPDRAAGSYDGKAPDPRYAGAAEPIGRNGKVDEKIKAQDDEAQRAATRPGLAVDPDGGIPQDGLNGGKPVSPEGAASSSSTSGKPSQRPDAEPQGGKSGKSGK